MSSPFIKIIIFLRKLGQTTAVNNIYDMGGNVWEWTTESCSDTSSPFTCRGDYYYNYFATYPAGGRTNVSDKKLKNLVMEISQDFFSPKKGRPH